MQCGKYQQEHDKLQKLCEKYQQKNEKLRKKVVDDEFFADDDAKTKYYTGLPSYELLKVMFSFVIIGLPASY